MAPCPLFLVSLRCPHPLADAGRYPPLAGSADVASSTRPCPRPRPGRQHGNLFRCDSTSSSSAPRGRPPRRQRSQRPGGQGDPVDPVGFLAKLGVSDRAFAQFLRDRHKALKDRRWELCSRFIDLKEASSGFELLGMHRHRQHRIDFMEWAPGARYCSLVGDFNEWSPTENCAREGHLGHDDFGYWFIILEDKLREGQEPDEYFFQEYNYVDDYDKGDNGVDAEEIMHRVKEEYWEHGEIRSRKSQLEMVVKMYEQMFGPNGPQTEEELDEILNAQTRYNEWKALQKANSLGLSHSYDIIDSGQPFDIFNVVTDRASFEKFQAKKPPLAYWVEMRKGRIAWLEKYVPTISHKDKYRVYFNTPDGALERVPAWATYVLPAMAKSICRNRQWQLLDKGFHKHLFDFDKDIMSLDENERIISRGSPNIHHCDDTSMVICFTRGPFLFVFNFNPEVSHQSYYVGVDETGEYQLILNSDETKYGGCGELKNSQYMRRTCDKRVDGCRNSLELALPFRSAQVYKLVRILRI